MMFDIKHGFFLPINYPIIGKSRVFYIDSIHGKSLKTIQNPLMDFFPVHVSPTLCIYHSPKASLYAASLTL
jgi:hypothetical protein